MEMNCRFAIGKAKQISNELVSKGEITAVGKLLSLYFERLPFVKANVSLRSDEAWVCAEMTAF